MSTAPALEAFDRMAGATDTALRASLLINFAKQFDLTSPEMHSLVQKISDWVHAPDPELRRAVVFSLCFFRPVAGFEWVILAGWPTAPVLDLHWYAGAVESTYPIGRSVDRKLVLAIVKRLLESEPGSSGVGPQQESWERETERAILQEASMRALLHLVRVMDSDELIPDTADPYPKTVEWRQVCVALYVCARPGDAGS
jgi:hypothetical protein